ncbi:MAG: DNA repair protein RecO [Acutalibacteraceae bacterium]
MHIEIKGIIIKEANYKDNDKVLTIFTAERGVISAVARGCKKIKNRIGAMLQVFSYCSFVLSTTSNGYFVQDAVVNEIFFGLRGDLEKLALAQYFCELTLALSPEYPDSQDFLKLLLNSLFYISNGKKNDKVLKSIFELRGCSMCGYEPNLVGCAECKKYIAPTMNFSIDKGVLVCEECKKREENAIFYKISEPVVLSLKYIVYSPIDKIFSFKISTSCIKILSKITEIYIVFHLNCKFKSLDFYNSLTNLN